MVLLVAVTGTGRGGHSSWPRSFGDACHEGSGQLSKGDDLRTEASLRYNKTLKREADASTELVGFGFETQGRRAFRGTHGHIYMHVHTLVVDRPGVNVGMYVFGRVWERVALAAPRLQVLKARMGLASVAPSLCG